MTTIAAESVRGGRSEVGAELDRRIRRRAALSRWQRRRGPVATPFRAPTIPRSATPRECGVPAPQLSPSATRVVRLRRMSVATASGGIPDRGQWRLTDRGIAVVMALATVLVVASFVAIGTTWFEVTGG